MTQRGLLICFAGIDGSGKTTQAKLLVNWLSSRNVKSRYMWSRGEVLAIRRILLIIGRRALGTSSREIDNDKKSYREYQDNKSKLLQNSFIRLLWSTMTFVEHLIQINRDIRNSLLDGWIVVCDRYIWDSSVDMAVLNKKKPVWLSNRLNRFLRKLIPEPTITFLIDISPEVAMQRKNDIPSYDYVKKRAELYQYLARINSFSVINGSEDVIAIHNKILDAINVFLEGKDYSWPS